MPPDANLSPNRPGVSALWLLAAAAALSSAAALPLQFVGEEGILAITSLEMWQRRDWLRLWLFGIDHQHGVFANWLIIPAAAAIGWDHVLAVTRGVMIAATAASGALAAFLAHRLWRDVGFAVFAGAVYLTFADVLLYRGWLGYRDPLFGFLVFAAMAGLWLGARERRTAWLVASAVAVSAAFLTKGIIAYVFVGTAALVLLFHPAYRAFLLRPASIAVAAGCAAALAWWLFGVHGDRGQGMRMTSEILAKLEPESFRAYLVKLAAFPLEVLLRLAPVSLLAGWLLVRTAPLRAQWLGDPDVRTALAIAALCVLPYWIAPHWHIRYLAPVLPLIAMILAAALWFADGRHLRSAMRWMWAAVALKLVLLLAVFPYYQQAYRGENFEAAARDIVARTAGHPLYSTNVSATGLSVAALIDLKRLPAPPIVYAPQAWDDGYVITYGEKDTAGRVVARYRFGGAALFLLCRGSACPSGAAQP